LVGWLGLCVLGIPLVAIVVQAFATRWFFPDLVPREWTTGPFGRVVGDPNTHAAVADSLIVGLAVVVAALLLAIPAARALALGRTRHAPLIVTLMLVPTVLPPVALAMGLNVALLRTDLAGSLGAVIVSHLVVALPYAVLLLAAALTRYDVGYERQARALGASDTRIILGVFLPLATPAILVTGALVFVVSWGQYLLTLLPGGGRVVSVPVLLLASANGGNPTATAVLALIAAVPPAIAVLAVVRHLDRLGAPRSVAI
jgi:putative spermidine/putrescine transport system permease protein